MIFVMAASGQLGTLVVDILLERGATPGEVVAGGRRPEKLARLADLGVTVRRADYEDKQSMKEAFEGVDTLILIPTKSAVVPRILEHSAALDAARDAGVRRVLLVSIASGQPDSLSMIAPFTLYSESATRHSGMAWLILRMGLYIEPLAEWAPELVEMGRLPYPVKQGRVSFLTRDDIARAVAAAALKPDLSGRVLKLTGSAALSMPELAAALSRATGAEVRFDSITDEEFLEICAKDPDTPDLIGRILVSLYHAVDAGEFGDVTSDIEWLTSSKPESVDDYLKRVLSDSKPTSP